MAHASESVRSAVRAVAAILTAGVAIAACGLPTAGADVQAFLPLSAVRPGMTGYGLTVVHGTTIERFDVRVLGVLTGSPGTDLILFRASGAPIQRAGGTASGMSGSPIYLGGRLAGALSYGYHFPGPDADLSLATPIEEMLKMIAAPSSETRRPLTRGDRPRLARGERPREYRNARGIATPRGVLHRIVLTDSSAGATLYNAHAPAGSAAVAPVGVPLVASGVTPSAFRVLERSFKRFNLVPQQRYAGRGNFPPTALEPGASLGIEMVRGDVEVGAIGTLTYRNGNAVIGFGHPLLNAGRASMLVTTAWIDTVVRSLDFPFKEGSFGPPAGTLTQDRMAGVAGTIGQFPRMFGIRVSTRDLDTGAARTFGAQAVRRQDLAEALVPTAVLSLIQRGLDRVAGGSAAIRITLRSRGLTQPVVRENLAYDVNDIATAAALDIPAATQLLFGNFFAGMDPVDIAVEVAVTAKTNTALLVGARPSARTVHPGDRVSVEVRIRPYGGEEPRSRTVEFTVPRDFPEGPAFLLVGTSGALNDSASPQAKFAALVALQSTPTGVPSLEEAIDQFEHDGKNTDVTVQLVPEAVLTAVGANANPSFESPAGTTVPTEWVVLGKFQIPMTVK